MLASYLRSASASSSPLGVRAALASASSSSSISAFSSSSRTLRKSALPTATASYLSQRHLYTSSKRSQASPAPSANKPSSPSPNDNFLSSNNAYYVEEMHRLWKGDPQSVHPSWNVYFSGLSKGMSSEQAFRPPPSLMPIPMDAPPVDVSSFGQVDSTVDDHLKVSGESLPFCLLFR